LNPDELPLRDIHLPAEVGFWPPAPGWWLLLLATLLLSFLLLRWLWRRPSTAKPSIASPALQELNRIERQYRDDPHSLVSELSVLLRRVAMSQYGREQAAGLTGDAWLQLLDNETVQGQGSAALGQRFKRTLTEMPYRRPGDDLEVDALLREVRRWLQHLQESPHV